MDMHAAYREVGSYRAAAEMCGTTPKTVRRSVEAARTASAAAPGGPGRVEAAVSIARLSRVRRRSPLFESGGSSR
jgi:hypothetical protein